MHHLACYTATIELSFLFRHYFFWIYIFFLSSQSAKTEHYILPLHTNFYDSSVLLPTYLLTLLLFLLSHTMYARHAMRCSYPWSSCEAFILTYFGNVFPTSSTLEANRNVHTGYIYCTLYLLFWLLFVLTCVARQHGFLVYTAKQYCNFFKFCRAPHEESAKQALRIIFARVYHDEHICYVMKIIHNNFARCCRSASVVVNQPRTIFPCTARRIR